MNGRAPLTDYLKIWCHPFFLLERLYNVKQGLTTFLNDQYSQICQNKHLVCKPCVLNYLKTMSFHHSKSIKPIFGIFCAFDITAIMKTLKTEENMKSLFKLADLKEMIKSRIQKTALMKLLFQKMGMTKKRGY